MHPRPSRRSLVLSRLVIIAGFVHVAALGCGEDMEICEEGSLGCACDESSECHDGLVCEDETCVASDGEGGDTAGSSVAPGTAGAPGSGDSPRGEGGANDGASQGGAGAPVDSPAPGASQGGVPGADGEGSTESGGAPSSGNGGSSAFGSGGASGGSGGSSGGSEGSSGGSGGTGTSPFPSNCSGCYVEFGCFPEHLDCTSDPDCAPCVSTGYSPSLCDANPAFQALLECACASPCESHCSAVCD